MKPTHHHRDSPIYVLIATNNQDDQHLIAQSLQATLPQVQLIYSSTADQTLESLQTKAAEYYSFPRLLVLDLEIADRPIAWQLLEKIKLNFGLLPVIITSLDPRLETTLQVYSRGAQAFVRKPMDWAEWKEKLDALSSYWLQIVTLPKQPPL